MCRGKDGRTRSGSATSSWSAAFCTESMPSASGTDERDVGAMPSPKIGVDGYKG